MYLGSLLRNRCRARRIRDRPSVFYHKRTNRFHACGARVCCLCRCRPPQGLYGDVAGLGQEKKQFY